MSTRPIYAKLSALLVCYTLGGASQAVAQSPGLMDLYETALQQDAILHAEIARLDALKTESDISRADLLPQINLNLFRMENEDQKIIGSFFRSDGGGNTETRTEYSSFTSEGYAVELSQTIFDLRKFAQYGKSKLLAAQTEVQTLNARQSLIIRLTEAYFAVLLADAELKFSVSEREAVAKQLDDAQARFRVGSSARTDVKEAQAAYDLAVADEITASNTLDNTRYALAKIVGNDIHALRTLSADFPIIPPQPDDVEQWVSNAQKDNLQVLSGQFDVAIALKEVKLQSAGHWPRLDLFASKEETDVDGGPAPNTRFDEVWGLRLQVPIFLGGATHYKTKQATLRHRQALQTLENEYRESRRNTRATYMNVVADIKRISALKRARESAQASLESIQQGFKVGTRVSSDVLDAVREVFRARRDLINARHQYALNSLRLKFAVGKLSLGDVKNIDEWLK